MRAHRSLSAEEARRDGESRLDGSPAVICEGIDKRFGHTHALKNISLQIGEGGIHAFVGENGAGKSTLLGVMAGRVAPSHGRVQAFGSELTLGDPRASRAAGIVAIYQELTIVPALSVRANVFLGQTLSRRGVLSEGAMNERFEELSEQMNVELDPDARAGSLSVADQQLVEIMRALQAEARMILFDEPTAPLAPAERGGLFRVMKELRSRGNTLIFVSHNLEEVLDISDSVTVFRDGRLRVTRPAAEWTKTDLVQEMLGGHLQGGAREGGDGAAQRRLPGEAPAVRAQGISIPGTLHDVDITIDRGEIVGVAGLVGSGRTSLLRALAGLAPKASGSLWIGGKQVPWPRSIRDALRYGIALVPEDRKRDGLVPGLSAMDNVTLSSLAAVSRKGWISARRMRAAAATAAEQFGFDPKRLDDEARNLSGGNQQKLLLARWAHSRPTVLLADEPTRGIDVGAKEEIMNTLRGFAAQGVGVVVVSSELEEIVAIADRIVVLSRGRAVAKFDDSRQQIGEREILHAAFNLEEQDAIH